jgi:hypothetical protein
MIYADHLIFLGQWNLEVSHDRDISNQTAETAPHTGRMMGG